MAIKPTCDKCKKELEEFGGILLSPPDKNKVDPHTENGVGVKKFHLCKNCYNEIFKIIYNPS